MKRFISIILTLLMLTSMVSVSFISTNAATTDSLPFGTDAVVSKVISGFVPYKDSSKKYYKIDGSGTIKSSSLKESKFSSSYQYPYVVQGATAAKGAYYITATYHNANALTPNNYEYGYIIKYVVAEDKYYISDKLPIGHGNCMCYNPDKNWLVVTHNAPNGQMITIVDPDTLTTIGKIDVGSEIGSLFATQYNRETKQYVLCTSGANTKNYIVTISDDLKVKVIKSYYRNDLNQDTSKSPCYLKQGLYATPDYLMYPFSRKPVGDGPNIIRITDWDGNLIQDVKDPHEKEIEDIMADEEGKIYFVYHDNSARGAVYLAKMAAYTVKYLPNGGTGTMADSAHVYGTSKTLTANAYKKSGYAFKGWNLSRESDGKSLYTNDGGSTNSWYTEGEQPEGWVKSLYADKKSVSALSHRSFDVVYCEAQWGTSTSKYYGITFDTNGGEGEMEPIVAKDGSKITLPENTMTRKGYTFAGWTVYRYSDKKWNYTTVSSGSTSWKTYTTSSSYKFTVYQPGQSVSALGYSGKKDNVKLICQWEKAKGYNVNFDANGGNGTMNSITIEEGATATLPANTLTKAGYTFAGWKADDGKVYADKASVKDLGQNGGNVTLTAQWTANTYTVKFNANGGSGTMADMTMTYDKSATLTANAFTKTGYTFAGWTNGSTTYTDAQSVKNLATSGTVTLTAKWTASSYTIKFNANGGTGTMADMAMTYDTAKNLTANAFTKTGYTFAGWTAGGKTYADKAEVKNLATSGTVTFTANWTANTYKVKFDANGGTGTMSEMSMTYDTAKALTKNTFTRENYKFVGWSYNGTIYEDGQSVKNLATSGTVTLKAQWTAVRYKIAFAANGAEGTMSEMTVNVDVPVSLPANAFTKANYTFNGWKAADGNVYADGAEVVNLFTENDVAVLTAQWTANTYTIKFAANGGTGEMADMSMSYDVAANLTTNAFTKKGYTFAGWTFDGKTYADKAEVINLATSGEVTFTAKWTANKYTIKFAANGGNGTMADMSMTYGKAADLTANAFTRTGYTFAGWLKGSTAYTDGQSVKNLTSTANGTVTLTAQWTANTYTVKFDANGGEGAMSDLEMTYGTGAALTPNAFTKDGYKFLGWEYDGYTYADNAVVNNLTATDGAVVTLTAKWGIPEYTIKYDANGGNGTMADQIADYDVDVALNKNTFTKTGYKFAGWTDGENTYADKQTVKNLTTSSITLTAQWTPISYTIKFAAGAGTGSMESMVMLYGEEKNLTLNEFTHETKGQGFANWKDSSGNTYEDGEAVMNLTTTDGATITLTAQWEKVTYTVRFDANGGTGTMADQAMTYGTKTTISSNKFTRSGYSFMGWHLYRKADGKRLYKHYDGTKTWFVEGEQTKGYSIALYSNQQSVSALSHYNKDVVTVKAQWKPNSTGKTTYYLRFEANGGVGEMEDCAVVYKKETPIPECTITRDGYKFLGYAAHRLSDDKWRFQKSGGSASFADWEDRTSSSYSLYLYQPGEKVSTTSSTNRDIVEMVCIWEYVGE